MLKTNYQKSQMFARVVSLATLCVAFTTCNVSPTLAGQMLNGNVQETDTLKGPSGLSRSDIKQGGDPFGSGGGAPKQEAFDAAAGAFDFGGRQAPAPPPKKQLQGNAQDAGMANFQNGVPQFANQQQGIPQQPMNAQQPMQQGNARQADANEEPELKLLWDAWHKNVALTIYQRFSTLSNKFFAHGQPLRALVAYSVTRDGHIVNAHLTEKSPNIIYNTMVLTVVNSINGDVGILAFPQGSRRQSVEKSGDFTVNWGPQEGFKYTKNDSETVSPARR